MFTQKRKYLLAVVLTTLISVAQPLPAQQNHSTPVSQAQRQLLQLEAPDSLTSSVPEPIKASIVRFKRALTDQTDAVMTRSPVSLTAVSAKHRLSVAMPSPTVGKISDEQLRKIDENLNKPVAGLYGDELTISVSQPEPSLLLVQETFGIACGTDNILLGYSNADGAWKRILLWQSDPYDEISGAFGDTYKTLLLKPEHNHHPLLLVVHGTPWCTSTDSAFAMDIFELESGAKTTPLWHRDHGYRRADLDPPLTLRRTEDGFEVRTSVDTTGDNISRKGVMRYSVTPIGIHRVEPLAMNGRDSIEEWLKMPREDAAEFADHPESSLTWQMFQDFTYEGKDKGTIYNYPKFGAVRPCKDSATHFQVEVTSEIFDSSKPGSRPGPAYFVQLQEVSNGYRIHTVAHQSDGSCTGSDLMAGS